MKISVIGTGYVGLVSGVCFAEKGYQVICVDIDQDKINKINQGIPPIYEQRLEELLKKNIHKNLLATTDLNKAIKDTDISLIAVGTPFDGKEIDLRYIKKVSHQIGSVLRDKRTYHVVVVKSTVVPGTTEEVVLPILEKSSEKKAGIDFGLGMTPEFLKEGEAVQDFMYPDRIVIGGINAKTLDLLSELYSVFPEVDILKTNCKTAEMIKYAANSLLATMISFANEMANLCAVSGNVDIVEVMKGVYLDKRLTPINNDSSRIVPSFTTYLEAGCGFGGSCFPKDIQAISAYGAKLGNSMHLLQAVLDVNKQQPYQMLNLFKKNFHPPQGVKVAVLGLAFKPGTDDIRESPSIPIIQSLLEMKCIVQAYDPVANSKAEIIFLTNQITFCETLKEALTNVQAIFIMTKWQEFRKIPELLVEMNSSPLVIDGRRIIDKNSVASYEGIGLSK
ncbi:UDP-glucose/GDP-mannose dehydrogenase family protein [Gloeocapsa sp. PCC 73106]|uniref:UDP-glucose dehydrogenase family protein n=1 Tax=Gloeocapsa sp. PCC 73106 TaxID=102232 RepID=UPI0002AC7AC5|nr:UDP-glucose/GDP-mannose dehydrogenase family protein [Gloeocapsa sp. PCC 73106]ELR98322.1 nucleotide sugar dehydrogenase [Gloeocapsa sp. PCC 73106]